MTFSFQSPDESWRYLYKLASDYDIGLFIRAGVSKNNKIPDWKSHIALIGNLDNSEVDKFQEKRISLATLADIEPSAQPELESAIKTIVFIAKHQDVE